MPTELPLIISVLIAALGSVGGFAALMKVNADNSKTVSEGATLTVKMLRDQVNDLDARMGIIERYAQEMEVWGERVSTLLEKSIDAVAEARREPFRIEAEALAASRPRRGSMKVK